MLDKRSKARQQSQRAAGVLGGGELGHHGLPFQVAKASQHTDPVPDVEILIGPQEPPAVTDRNYEAVYRQCFHADATRLFEALTSLPGGTWDRLFALMVEKKASLLKVPLFSVAPRDFEFGPTYQVPTRDFPTVIQSVLKTAGDGHALHLNVASTYGLASEIRKLLERRPRWDSDKWDWV